MELLKLLSANEVFAQIVSFLILLFLLRLFVWKKFLKILDDRKAKIAGDFKEIEDKKAAAAKMQADYEARFKVIEDTARAKIQEAVISGQKITEELKNAAQEEAQKILEKAKAGIKYEIAKAKEELKEETVDLVLSTTEKLIKQKFSEEDDRNLVKDLLKNSGKL